MFSSEDMWWNLNTAPARLSKSDVYGADKCLAKKYLRMKICRKGHNTQKKCVKISKIRLK